MLLLQRLRFGSTANNSALLKTKTKMEPTRTDKPSLGLFLLMTAVYFGAYFGLKYGVFGGALPWYFNAALIVSCLLLALALRNKFQS